MDAATRRLVRRRARDTCEYCRLKQEHEPFLTFHVEHIIAKQHGGGDDHSNLCLACSSCNLHKGPNIAGVDPQSGALTPLFNPRNAVWSQHFEWRGSLLFGKTATGRATVAVLGINLPENVEQRDTLRDEGVFPPG